MAKRLSDLELDAWQALLHAHHQIVGALDAELRAEHRLTFGDYDVLLRLARARVGAEAGPEEGSGEIEGRLRMSELARRVMISPSGLTRAVDRLAAAGLVARERDADDARVLYAFLTPAGRDAVRRAARTHLRGIREHFTAKLTEDQLRQVAAALQVITGPHEPH